MAFGGGRLRLCGLCGLWGVGNGKSFEFCRFFVRIFLVRILIKSFCLISLLSLLVSLSHRLPPPPSVPHSLFPLPLSPHSLFPLPPIPPSPHHQTTKSKPLYTTLMKKSIHQSNKLPENLRRREMIFMAFEGGRLPLCGERKVL